MALVSFTAHVVFAYAFPTIWALVMGGLASSAAIMVASYFLLADVRQRFHISKEYGSEILHFGKWIFLSSALVFLATSFDRLYLAKVVPLNLLGIYGIARSISELLGGLIGRLGNFVLFPFLASHSHISRHDLHVQLAPLRVRFLLLLAVGFSLFAAVADLVIKIVYDQRYSAAAWMLPVLIIGSWFSVLANLNEATLLGLGRPSYTAISNGSKLMMLILCLPLSLKFGGLTGAVVIVAAVDLGRYFPILAGQRREHFSFGAQDILITIVMFALLGAWQWIRWSMGLGTSFDSLPWFNPIWK
jgi:O-antigen/teichoic acid export membrane protein